MTSSRIVALVSQSNTLTIKLDDYLTSNHIPSLHFDEDLPVHHKLPTYILATQEALSEALDELYRLTQSPVRTVFKKSI